MNHESLQDHQIPDRYVLGKLSPEERSEFEEHFLDCPVCLDQLETLEGLTDGLKALARQELPASSGNALGRLEKRTRRTPNAVLLLAAACFVLAIVPSAFLFRELQSTRGDLESVRKASVDAQRERDGLAKALERERAERSSATKVTAPLAVSVFTLNVLRGVDPRPQVDRILIGDPGAWAIFLIDRPDPRRESYRARIATSDGRAIGVDLTASAASGDMLAVAVPPGLLVDGDFVLTLEGTGGVPPDLARYRFHAAVRKQSSGLR